MSVNTYPTYLDKLIKLNNTLLRILQFKPFDFPTLQLYKNFNTLPLSSLYEQQVLMFVHKFVHHSYKLSPVFVDYFRSKNLVHDYNTRCGQNLFLSGISTSFGQRSLKFQGSLLWNRLPSYYQNIQSARGFLKKIRKLLLLRNVC